MPVSIERNQTLSFLKHHGMKTKYFFILLAVLILSTGCGRQQNQGKHELPPPEVGVITITTEPVSLVTELPGRVNPVRTAQVRARATGILLKRTFEEGVDVKAGDVLFEIDPAPLEAASNAAKARLARAEATLAQVESKVKRYEELVKIHAVSQQDYDDVTALKTQSQADVQVAKADVETANLNLGYAAVTAPISGRIGPALVTEGALVSQNEATQMAVIQQLDPVYFDFPQSSTEVLRLKQAFDRDELQTVAPGEAKVTLLLEDGTVYPHSGKLLFSGVSVDPATGMITLRAEFPNPDHLLLPGMFGRVRFEQAVNTNAITAPQRGIILGPNGTATAMVVTKDNKVEPKSVKIGRAIEENWIITEGLLPGEQVIVEGLQKVRPGATVKPVPFIHGKTGSSNSPQMERH